VTLGDAFTDVLAAARTGAEWAWIKVYRSVAPAVLGYFRYRGVPEPDDLTGEVFVNVVRDLPRFHGNEREFRAWVLTIAHRRLVDELRSRSRGRPDPIEQQDLLSHALHGDAEKDALDRLGLQLLHESISRLTPDQQDVILLRLLGDMTVDEVAVALEKRPSSIKALQRRALARLRREISTQGVSQ